MCFSHTFRFGNQVGLSPRFSRSISSTLSDVPKTGNLKPVFRAPVGSFFSCSGVSGTGPSHKSVRMLSSEIFLVITFLSSGGVVERSDRVDFVGGVPRPLPMSSWKIGILEPFQTLL